jgi:hypothetical protein
MSASEVSTASNPSLFSSQRVEMPKWPHIVLVTGSVALLIIGILATLGILNGMGTTNAAYLSYGMYGGAALFALAEIAILIRSYCPKKEQHRSVDLELEARLDPGLMLETILTAIARPRHSPSHPLPGNTLPTPYTLLCTTLTRSEITKLKSQVSRQVNPLEMQELQATLAQIEMMQCSPPIISIALKD